MHKAYRSCWSLLIFLLVSCVPQPVSDPEYLTLPADVYLDKVHGAWQAMMVADQTGQLHEGKYLHEPSPARSIELQLPDHWTTDDGTAIEWVDLHILETHGLDPTYAQIRDEWRDHLNHDIWVATLRARQLMDQGVLPPDTGSAALNPDGVWSMDAQLETELLGLIAPGLPDQAARRATYFAQITNSGLAVQASAFYADLYALAFFEADVPTLVEKAQTHFPADSEINQIVDNVQAWHKKFPDDWRNTRQLIRDAYDTDPAWWASKVNFASTMMALLYGQGDLLQTMTIASLAGWDADDTATTSSGLVGLILGYDSLPESVRNATDIYYNEDVTGNLPKYQTVSEISTRTQAIAKKVVLQAGGRVEDATYLIPVGR